MIFLLNGLVVIYAKLLYYCYRNMKGPGRWCKVNMGLFEMLGCKGNLPWELVAGDLSCPIACYVSSAEAGVESLWPVLEKIYAR